MKYTYRIIDDHYLEMGGEPYEYGEVELVTFLANEVRLMLFEKAIPLVMDQTDKKEWSFLHRRIKCKIFEGDKLVTWCAIDEYGHLSGDDGGGWAAVLDEDEDALIAAGQKVFSPEYLKLMADVAAGKHDTTKKIKQSSKIQSTEALEPKRQQVGRKLVHAAVPTPPVEPSIEEKLAAARARFGSIGLPKKTEQPETKSKKRSPSGRKKK